MSALLGPGRAEAGGRFLEEAAPRGVPPSELEVRLVPDLALTAGMLGVALLLERSKEELRDDLSCPEDQVVEPEICDAAMVNPLDRLFMGRAHPEASAWSDVLLLGLATAPLAFSAVDAGLRTPADASSPGARLGRDTLVVAQTYAATYLATNVTKLLVQRLRPFNYDPRFRRARLDGDSRVSFPSGHSSMAFASAATLSVLLEQRYPGEPWATGLSVGAFAVAGTVAVLRVLAERHFPSDVLVGAALGTTLGLLIPRFHRGRGVAVEPAVASPVLLGLGGRF